MIMQNSFEVNPQVSSITTVPSLRRPKAYKVHILDRVYGWVFTRSVRLNGHVGNARFGLACRRSGDGDGETLARIR